MAAASVRTGTILLGWNVHSTHDIVGKIFDSAVAGIECSIYAPSLVAKEGSEDEFEIQAPLGGGWPKHRWWGIYGKSDRRVIVNSFGVTIDGRTSSTQVATFNSGIDSWGSLVLGWLSTLAGEPIEFIGSRSLEITWAEEGQVEYDGVAAGLGMGNRINAPHMVTVREWERALHEAGVGSEPPLARTLFVDVLRAIEARRWRSAVVDAATCAEVALTKGISQLLVATSTPDISAAILGQVRMLHQMTTLAKNLGLSVPSNIHDDLIVVRNNVVHRGMAVGSLHAARAADVARTIIDMFEPMP